MTLVGRDAEYTSIRERLSRARNGLGAAVVLRGDPGMGKSALLSAVTSAATDMTVIRADGYEAEAAMPYGGLHRLGLRLLHYLPALTDRHREALTVAWGAQEGPAPDRFLVGLAMLALCAAAGADRPLVCVADDAHWLDPESLAVLAFVARRLTAEATVLLFATRDNADTDTALAGIDEVRLTGLDPRSAARLLTAGLGERSDPLAAQRIAEATGGNPLALLDLARDLSVRQISDLTLAGDPVPIGKHLEAHYLRQVRQLSSEAQTWLLVAATASAGHTELIARTAEQLGSTAEHAAEALAAGLVSHDTGSTDYRHPLIRSAVYMAATGVRRRQIHTALSVQAEHLGLADVAVWHAARAALGPAPEVADRLDDVAQRAGRRGGLTSQAGLLNQAAELTPPGPRRNARLLAAAEAAGAAGAAHLSRDLLDRINTDHLDDVHHGRLLSAETEWAMFVADPAAVMRGPAQLLAAASHFHGPDCAREHRALRTAFEHALVTEQQMQGTDLKELGSRLQTAVQCADGAPRVLLAALSAHLLAPYAEAVAPMRAALAVLRDLDDAALQDCGFVGIAFATALFDDVFAEWYLDRLIGIARDNGNLRALDTVLWVRASFEIGRSNPAAARMFMDQVRELRRAIGYDAENVVNAPLLAWSDTPPEHVDALAALIAQMGFGGVRLSTDSALAVRDIAENRYPAAFDRLAPLIARPFLQVTYLQLADFAESAVRSGHLDQAVATLTTLAAMAVVNDSAWLHGLHHRCQALLTDDEKHYQRAIELLSSRSVPAELARTRLLYGEWLRRRKRRRAAREELRAALEVFERLELAAFAERARSELAATGENPTQRESVAGVQMSPREAAVAGMAAGGATNAEIAAALFISVNTVDYHLRKVFAKLSISSRRQLSERFTSTTT